jgi:hypothetical protein
MMNPEPSSSGSAANMAADWQRKFQYLLDKTSPHSMYRWIGFAVLMSLYILRVYLVNGWYIVTYGLGIYLLNQFIGFLTPQVCDCTCFVCSFWRFVRSFGVFSYVAVLLRVSLHFV